jgi:hypothetical protein
MRDGSVNSTKPNNASDPDYIMREILKPRIDWAGALVVLVSAETKNSEWVDREIRYAARVGKPVIGVWDHGESGCELPQALIDHGHAMVGWRGERIIDAIDGRLTEWLDADDRPMPPRPIPRHNC